MNANRVEVESDSSPLDRVKTALLDLPPAERQKVYEFLYSLGHWMF